MTIALNGTAIIAGQVVPPSEVQVLKTIFGFDRDEEKPTVTQIHQRMSESISYAACYTCCQRLNNRGGLVQREDIKVSVCGTKLSRIVWSVTPLVVEFFKQEELKQ